MLIFLLKHLYLYHVFSIFFISVYCDLLVTASGYHFDAFDVFKLFMLTEIKCPDGTLRKGQSHSQALSNGRIWMYRLWRVPRSFHVKDQL